MTSNVGIGDPVLKVRGVVKTYPGVTALTGVSLEVRAGEVHALMGQNGAGKSTLMKIIAGAEKPDSGEMELDGHLVPFGSPQVSHAQGIGIVYQELSLVPSVSIGENVFMGRWHRRGLSVDIKATEAAAEDILRRVGLNAPARTLVSDLGIADRQLVEIAKALSTDTKVLLLDEPTSALSNRETARLFEVIRGLTATGVAVIYVSHRLPEVLEICDVATVMRDGAVVSTVDIADVDEESLARQMVGSEMDLDVPAPAEVLAHNEVVLRANGLAAPPRLGPIDLTLHAGEVVTVFGLVGSGRTRLARTLFGLERATQGTLELFGNRVELSSPQSAIRAGLGFVGEDRGAGLVPMMSVAQNIALASLPKLGNAFLFDEKGETAIGEEYARQLRIKTPTVKQRISALSGGNQQKALFARWISRNSRILVLDDPVRGIDVGGKSDVYRVVREQVLQGVAVIYFTSEIREATMLGNRVLVMARGVITGEFTPDATEEEIMVAAGGAYV